MRGLWPQHFWGENREAELEGPDESFEPVFVWRFAAATLALTVAGPVLAQDPPPGEALYQAHCAMCHDSGFENAPPKAAMAVRPAADIEAALKTGTMTAMAKDLDAGQIAAIAAYLGKAPASAAPAVKTPSAGGDDASAARVSQSSRWRP